jgi:hypothetical protein
VLTACSFDEKTDAAASNQCTQDSECGEGNECRDKLCVSTQYTPLWVALRVTPSYSKSATTERSKDTVSSNVLTTTSQPSVAAVLPPFELSGSRELPTTKIPLLVEVAGNITHKNQRVAAQINFTPKENAAQIESDKLSTNTTGTLKSNSAGEKVDYVVQVLQNVPYDISIIPLQGFDSAAENSMVPPFYGEFTAEKAGGNSFNVSYDDSFTPEERVYRLKGTTTGQRLKAYAVKASNIDERISTVNSITTQDTETTFSLAFSTPLEPSIALVIEPETATSALAGAGNGSGSLHYPKLLFTPGALDIDKTSNETVATLPSDVLPAAVTITGSIDLCDKQSIDTGKRGNWSQEPLQVQLYSTALTGLNRAKSPIGSYEASTKAIFYQESAKFEFTISDVFPGKYQMIIAPPTASECGIFAKALTVQSVLSDQAPQAVTLQFPNSAYIKGVLQTPEGQPVVGAGIFANALRREGIDLSDQPGLTAYNRSKQTTTDTEGKFQIPVDIGSYDLIVKPPAGSGYAWQIFHDVNIGTPATFDRVIEMVIPMSVTGKLEYDSSDSKIIRSASALQGAEVRAYAVFKDKTLTTRAIEIATATADEISSFTLLISGELYDKLY